MEEKSLGRVIFEAILSMLLTVLICLVLWNWMMPIIFGLPSLTYFQMLGIYLLVHLLFPGKS